ncbi:unnamed protein product [Symbiodinium microadriaticum]|nr:unnamed protein product [Symbiodinium microadriaticum]CAE7601165.1 ACT1 [Symbiodinium sp. KB8]
MLPLSRLILAWLLVHIASAAGPALAKVVKQVVKAIKTPATKTPVKPPMTKPPSPPPKMNKPPSPPPKMQYTKKDAAKDTGVSLKEVSKAWHQARDDAQKAGELPERAARKAAQAARAKKDL